MTKQKSEFEQWFVAQHGKRNTFGFVGVHNELCKLSDDELQDAVTKGRIAERMLQQRNTWDQKQESALYAWSAKTHIQSALEVK